MPRLLLACAAAVSTALGVSAMSVPRAELSAAPAEAARVQPAAATSATVDVEALGPQVGDRVPEFSGVDQFGRTQTLQSVAGPDGAMLVFFRSADW